MIRKLSLCGLIMCIAAVGGALFLEHQYMLAVCPLCILQRIIFYILIPVFLLGTLLQPQRLIGKIYSFILFICAFAGTLLASRQVWLQYFAPPQKITCSASLERLIKVHPFLDAMKIAILGSGECSEIDFTILGLSLAVWSLLLFITLAVIAILCFRQTSR